MTARAAALAYVGAVAFLALLIAVHFLRPDVDPFKDDVSAYAIGAYGALMATAFVVLGASVVAAAVALFGAARGGRGVRAGAALLALAGVGGTLVAAFPSNAPEPVTHTDYAEVAASLVFFVGFALGSGLVSFSAWTGGRRDAAVTLSVVFLACFLAMLFGPDRFHGLLMRVAVGFLAAWIMVAATWLAVPAQDRRDIA